MHSLFSEINSNTKKSFFLFLVLTLITAVRFLMAPDNALSLGVLTVLWGVFGLYRLVYLNHDILDNSPKMMNLPLQILFGAGQKEYSKRAHIMKRYIQPDVILWLVMAFVLMIWVLYNSFFPLPLSFENFGPQGFNFPSLTSPHPYALLLKFSTAGLFITMVFLAISFSQRRLLSVIGSICLSPFIFLGLFKLITTDSLAMAIIFPDLSQYKGLGYHQLPLELLTNDQLPQTPMIQRYMALGSLGAYGLYALLIPPAWMFIQVLIKSGRSFARPLIGLIGLTFLVMIDIVFLSSAWSVYLSLLISAVVALCWGSMIRYK